MVINANDIIIETVTSFDLNTGIFVLKYKNKVAIKATIAPFEPVKIRLKIRAIIDSLLNFFSEKKRIKRVIIIKIPKKFASLKTEILRSNDTPKNERVFAPSSICLIRKIAPIDTRIEIPSKCFL
jgi:hypothetical protein